jgi:hypothetical protein
MQRHDARQWRAARSERAMAMYADRRGAEAHAGVGHSAFIVRPTANRNIEIMTAFALWRERDAVIGERAT